jgi:hypothetical protein
MSRHHRVGESADLISPAPKTDFFNTIGQKRSFGQRPLCAMCGRLSVGKGFLDVLPFGRCGHVCGLLMRHIGRWP